METMGSLRLSLPCSQPRSLSARRRLLVLRPMGDWHANSDSHPEQRSSESGAGLEQEGNSEALAL